jgi:hypothetical protein
MIAEFFMMLGADVSEWLSTLLVWDWLPLPSVDGMVGQTIANTASMGVWIPYGAIFAAVVATLSVWLVCLGIKALRAFFAHVPVVGGAG